MRAILRYLIVVIGCLHLCGGHYGVLQVIAWSQMIVEYSAEKGIIQGTLETFDGEHPCSLCLSISASKKEDKQQPFSPRAHQGFELKGLFLPGVISLRPARSLDFISPGYSDPNLGYSQFGVRPPTPPPRKVIA